MILFKFLDPDCDSGSDDEDDNPLPSDGKWDILDQFNKPIVNMS